MAACGEWGQRPVDRFAFAKLDAPFTCYHSVCSTCQFSQLGKLPEQSDMENIVHGVKRQIRACTQYLSLTYTQKHTDTHGDILSDDTVFLLNAWIRTFTLRYSNLNTITGLLSVSCCYQHFTEGTHSHVAVSVVRKWKLCTLTSLSIIPPYGAGQTVTCIEPPFLNLSVNLLIGFSCQELDTTLMSFLQVWS